MAIIPNNQQLINALKALPATPVAPQIIHPYTPPIPNLAPNLARDSARVQQVATGVAKPNQADWGR